MRDRRYSLWIAILAILLLINLPLFLSRRVKGSVREMVAPLNNAVSGISGRMSGSIRAMVVPGRAARELEELTMEVTTLRVRVRILEALEAENNELREQLGFAPNSAHKLVMCRVLARGDASGWWETVRLDKGTKDGLAVDMAVITRDGLVGKTISVSRNTADVLLITDPNCKAGAEFARTGAFGISAGREVPSSGDRIVEMRYPSVPAAVDYIPRNSEVRKGDKVITSGLGTVYPRGLLIGTVESVEVHNSGLYQAARIMPTANLEKLRYVFVVKHKGTDSDE